MRPRDQSQIARQFVDDDLLIRGAGDPRRGPGYDSPTCAEPTSPTTSAPSCFDARDFPG